MLPSSLASGSLAAAAINLIRKKMDYETNLKMFDFNTNSFVPLEKKGYVKYFGILVDSDLTGKPHIALITSKISKTISINATHFVPHNVLLNIYQSLVQPYLTYDIIVWEQAIPKLI